MFRKSVITFAFHPFTTIYLIYFLSLISFPWELSFLVPSEQNQIINGIRPMIVIIAYAFKLPAYIEVRVGHKIPWWGFSGGWEAVLLKL